MEIIRIAKVEILCILFGLIGLTIALNTNKTELGLGLSTSAVTSYFAFKRNDRPEED